MQVVWIPLNRARLSHILEMIMAQQMRKEFFTQLGFPVVSKHEIQEMELFLFQEEIDWILNNQYTIRRIIEEQTRVGLVFETPEQGAQFSLTWCNDT